MVRSFGRLWRQVRGLALAGACLVSFGAEPAAGQEPTVPPAAPGAGSFAPEPPPPAPPVAPAPVTPAAPEQGCVPACRSGYMCHEGQCVSLCNPPCASGERCLANGECERQSDEVEQDVEERPPARDNPILRPAGSWAFAARGGFQIIGGGELEGKCTSTGEPLCGAATATADFDERSYVMFGLDALIHVAPGLRLGAGYELVPYSAVKGERSDDDEDAHWGHEHALGGVIEGLLPVSSGLALAFRAHGGVRMLVLGGDLADAGERFLANCRTEGAIHCEIDEGPLFGSGFGAMFGFVGGSRLRWRVDLAVDRVSLTLPSSRRDLTTTESVSRSSSLATTRSWVLGGFEL